MRSRVMPGSSVTIERRVPVRRLKSVDLPTLGRPTITMEGSLPVIVFALLLTLLFDSRFDLLFIGSRLCNAWPLTLPRWRRLWWFVYSRFQAAFENQDGPTLRVLADCYTF